MSHPQGVCHLAWEIKMSIQLERCLYIYRCQFVVTVSARSLEEETSFSARKVSQKWDSSGPKMRRLEFGWSLRGEDMKVKYSKESRWINGKSMWKRMDTSMGITESLFCIPVTNTSLISYTPI